MFSGPEFPYLASGAGYAVSRGAASCMYKELLELPFLHLEDVFVTGFGTEAGPKIPSKINKRGELG